MKRTVYTVVTTLLLAAGTTHSMDDIFKDFNTGNNTNENIIIDEITINNQTYTAYINNNNEPEWVRKIGTIVRISEQEELRKEQEQENRCKELEDLENSRKQRVQTRAQVPVCTKNNTIPVLKLPQQTTKSQTNRRKRKNSTN